MHKCLLRILYVPSTFKVQIAVMIKALIVLFLLPTPYNFSKGLLENA